jgi:hypothetical protein
LLEKKKHNGFPCTIFVVLLYCQHLIGSGFGTFFSDVGSDLDKNPAAATLAEIQTMVLFLFQVWLKPNCSGGN